MALLDSTDFVFAGHSSRTFGLKMAWFEGDLETEDPTGLNIDLVTSNVNMARDRINLYGGTYSEPLQFSFALIRIDQTTLSRSESRAINNWLRGSNLYQKLIFAGNSDIYFNAVCTEISDVCYYGLNGKKVTFVCDSSYGYTREKTHTVIVSGTKTMKLYNSSDAGIYYPTLEIVSTGNNVKISNDSDDKSLIMNLSSLSNKKLIIDSSHCRITDMDGKLIPSYKIGWDVNDNIYWFRMLPGSNQVTLTGNCSVTFKCTFPRKEGVI